MYYFYDCVNKQQSVASEAVESGEKPVDKLRSAALGGRSPHFTAEPPLLLGPSEGRHFHWTLSSSLMVVSI